MNAFPPIDDELLRNKVTVALRRAIVSGSLKPGEKIVQEEIARQLGVSRMPLREALQVLAKEGLVVLEPRRGAVVAPMSWESVDEAYGLRLMLEPRAIELSVPRLDDADIAAAREILEEMEEAGREGEEERFVDLNRLFHGRLRAACPWPKLLAFVETLWNGLPAATPAFVDEQIQRDRDEHRSIFQAARARDGRAAAQAMERHIRRSWDMARQYFNRDG